MAYNWTHLDKEMHPGDGVDMVRGQYLCYEKDILAELKCPGQYWWSFSLFKPNKHGFLARGRAFFHASPGAILGLQLGIPTILKYTPGMGRYQVGVDLIVI